MCKNNADIINKASVRECSTVRKARERFDAYLHEKKGTQTQRAVVCATKQQEKKTKQQKKISTYIVQHTMTVSIITTIFRRFIGTNG